MGPRGSPETSVKDYHSALRNIPVKRISQVYDLTDITINNNNNNNSEINVWVDLHAWPVCGSRLQLLLT